MSCNKCKLIQSCIILKTKDKYCKQCFLTNTEHKFKISLGKNHLTHINDSVLLLYEVGHGSCAFLNFIKTHIDKPRGLRFKPIILFLEDQTHLNVSERIRLVTQIGQIVRQLGFPIYFGIQSQLLLNTDNLNGLVVNDENLLEFKSSDELVQLPKFPLQRDYLTILKRNLLIKIGRFLKCKYIFTPELATNVACQVLMDISTGRGSQLPFNIGELDTRHEDIQIVRPLRLFDKKELAFYNYFKKLNVVFNEPPTPVKSNITIENILKNFVIDLNQTFPSTITTILKTSDKLTLNKNESWQKCEFCQAPFEFKNDQMYSADSIDFSMLISKESSRNSINGLQEELKSNYICCYSCRKYIIDD